MDKPVIAITMGDPAGIGPELIVRVLSDPAAYAQCRPFVIGDAIVMADIDQVLCAGLAFRTIDDLAAARFEPGTVEVLRPEGVDVGHVAWGRLDPAMGQAAALCLRRACELALDGRIDGMVSAPMNKEAFHMAGYDYSDELVYMADLTHSPEAFIMGLMNDAIWTIAVTEHVPFREILPAIKKARVLTHIRWMRETLIQAGIASPRLAVAALNVHAGEGGLYGREEIDEIGPAIQAAQEKGIDVRGPVPADMVFVRALEGEFDGVVCMYHDQANIARKLQPKNQGATLFIGLPVPCGTTAHGTAFDKAGLGLADPGSLEAALRYTARLAVGRSASSPCKTSC